MRFAWDLYKGDEKWVPPLDMELLGNRIFRTVGLLTDKHPFHRHAEVVYFLAKKEGEIAGRVAGIVNENHIKFHKEKVGFFGIYESTENFQVASALLDNVRDWLKGKGMEIMRGPANFSSNESWGLLIENFDDYPMIYTPYNKKYYEGHFLKYGLKKSMDLIGQMMPVMDKTKEQKKRRSRLENISRKVRKKQGVIVRPVKLGKGFKEEFSLIKHIYNNAWSRNWGFVPITDEEFEVIAMGMKAVLRPGLASIAFVHDEPAGFIVNLPDINEFIRLKKSIFGNSDIVRLLRFLINKNRHRRVRLLLFGIVEKYRKIGLDSVLFLDSFRASQKIGIEECEISWLLETNELVIRHGEAMDAKEYRRWRLYDYPLN